MPEMDVYNITHWGPPRHPPKVVKIVVFFAVVFLEKFDSRSTKIVSEFFLSEIIVFIFL